VEVVGLVGDLVQQLSHLPQLVVEHGGQVVGAEHDVLRLGRLGLEAINLVAAKESAVQLP